VRILLARDDLDTVATDDGGSTALYYACYKGYAECVALLSQDRRMTSRIINTKDSVGKTPLMYAVRLNNIEIVRILLARDDLDIAATDSNVGSTALHLACMMGNAECVALLGNDRRMTSNIINIKDICGDTPLMMAVKHNHVSCVERMSELDGVDWETKTEFFGESLEDVARWVFAI
jgi:ankyrin repeat protein